MNSHQEDMLASYQQDLLGVFGTPQAVLERGEGCYVYDVEGKKYLDLLAGIAVNSLGHAHPQWVKELADQAGKLAHISNFFTSSAQLKLAQKLAELAGATEPVQAFFSNSGTEANEAAYKLARRFGNQTGKKKILALDHAFHGRTLGALALTWKEAYKEPFAPLPPDIIHIPASLEALEEHLDDQVAALIVEPIQGEAGVLALPDGYLQRARQLTREQGSLLLVDEVQTGMGRTGRWFECTRELDPENMPDVITLAKGLGGGFPIGAMLVFGAKTQKLLQPGMHGTTFGGNPLACAAALATLSVIDQHNLREHARLLGQSVKEDLQKIPDVSSVTGSGLLLGIHLTESVTDTGQPLAPAIVTLARDQGFIINATGECTLRLAPPLIISQEEIDSFSQALPDLIAQAKAAS